MRRLAISRAETTHQLDQKSLTDKDTQLKAEMKNTAEATATVKSTQEFIGSLNKEVEDVRNTLKTTREELDKTFASMVAQTDKVHQLMLLKNDWRTSSWCWPSRCASRIDVVSQTRSEEHDSVEGIAAACRGGRDVRSAGRPDDFCHGFAGQG